MTELESVAQAVETIAAHLRRIGIGKMIVCAEGCNHPLGVVDPVAAGNFGVEALSLMPPDKAVEGLLFATSTLSEEALCEVIDRMRRVELAEEACGDDGASLDPVSHSILRMLRHAKLTIDQFGEMVRSRR